MTGSMPHIQGFAPSVPLLAGTSSLETEDRASETIAGRCDGEYQVSFDFATPNAGSSVELSANGAAPKMVSLPATGEWQLYQRVEGGRLSFKYGVNTLSLRCVTKVGEDMGNLGEILLERTK